MGREGLRGDRDGDTPRVGERPRVKAGRDGPVAAEDPDPRGPGRDRCGDARRDDAVDRDGQVERAEDGACGVARHDQGRAFHAARDLADPRREGLGRYLPIRREAAVRPIDEGPVGQPGGEAHERVDAADPPIEDADSVGGPGHG